VNLDTAPKNILHFALKIYPKRYLNDESETHWIKILIGSDFKYTSVWRKFLKKKSILHSTRLHLF